MLQVVEQAKQIALLRLLQQQYFRDVTNKDGTVEVHACDRNAKGSYKANIGDVHANLEKNYGGDPPVGKEDLWAAMSYKHIMPAVTDLQYEKFKTFYNDGYLPEEEK